MLFIHILKENIGLLLFILSVSVLLNKLVSRLKVFYLKRRNGMNGMVITLINSAFT